MPKKPIQKFAPTAVFASSLKEAKEFLRGRNDESAIGWRPIMCAGYDLDENGKRHYHHIEGIECNCPPGPQYYSLWAQADEVALMGGRGSSKSEATMGFLIRGNLDPTGHPCDVTYVNHRDYRFLVLRSTAKDLEEYVSRFKQIAEPMGGHFTENPYRVRWDNGAEGLFFHMGDDSWKKMQGRSFVRIVIEEATHIQEEVLLEFIKSNRSKHEKHLKCQIMLTMNPNGPGLAWVNARYRYPGGRQDLWPSNKIYYDRFKRTRMYIHSTVDDNPYFLQGNQSYVRALDSLKDTSESEYRRMRLGDFDAIEGAYFQAFRGRRRPEEPENACHVVKEGSIALAPWWPRAIACDWGFSHKAAVGWGCWTPQRQMHVYREIVVSGVGTVELGARIAEASIDDLSNMERPVLTMYLSPDAFSRTDYTLTEAELIAQGIDKVMGSGMAMVAAPNLDEESLSEEEAKQSVECRILGSRAAIIIVRANNARKPGWQLIREYLRWWPLKGVPTEADLEHILRTKGELELTKVLRQIEQSKSETLPVLQIWSNCSNLIKGIQRAQESDTDSEDVKKVDDDEIDMLRYLCAGFRPQMARTPKEVWIQNTVEKVMANAPPFMRTMNSRIMASDLAERNYNKQMAGRAVTIRRPISHRPM